MKRILSFALALIMLTALIPVSASSIPDESAKSLVCIDRRYNFLNLFRCTSITGSIDHTAMLSGSTLWMFGSNKDGKLGIGDMRNSYNAPIRVMDDVWRVKVSDTATTVVKADRSVWVFGKNVSSTPKQLTVGCIDAHFDNGLAFVTEDGKAYFKTLQDETIFLCDNAAKIYVVFNGASGNGFTGKPSSDSMYYGREPSYFDIKAQFNIKTHFITVLKNDGTVMEYARMASGVIDSGTLVAENVSDMTMTYYYGSAYGAFIKNDGTLVYGDTATGTSTTKISDCKVCYYTPTGLFVLKTNGEVWNLTRNICLGTDAKLFIPVGNGGVFVVHNSGKVTANDILRSGEYAARLNAVNYGRPFVASRTMYDDIYAKTKELQGSETDKYIVAKKISEWISSNIIYRGGAHDQSGVAAFREGTGVCAAFADLTQIMLSYIGVPTDYVVSSNHAWNTAIIDGVTVFIDNTNREFDAPLFGGGIHHSNQYNTQVYDQWAADEVRAAFDYDLITRQMSFDYRDAITRADFCSLICNVIEKRKGKDIASVIADFGKNGVPVPFTDTDDTAVAALFCLGIINGTSEKTFSPNKNITREEAAKIMRNLALSLGEDVTTPDGYAIGDEKISPWAREGVSYVQYYSVMNGRPTGFDPKNTITIQESILVIYRFYIRLAVAGAIGSPHNGAVGG